MEKIMLNFSAPAAGFVVCDPNQRQTNTTFAYCWTFSKVNEPLGRAA
jgi:hypothetical protein